MSGRARSAPAVLNSDRAKQWLRQILRETLHDVRGDRLVERLGPVSGDSWSITAGDRRFEWPLPIAGRLIVIGAGKACAALARGLERVLGDRIDDGCIITKYGHREELAHIRQYEAGHPLPDEAGVAATDELLRTVNGLTARDCVIVLLTGGASSLLVAPVNGVSLAEKVAVTGSLLRSRAAIEEINCVRTALSRIKGGRLLGNLAPASVLTLLLSDVPSGDDGAIGSGPTIPRRADGMDAGEIVRRYGVDAVLPESVRDALARDRADATVAQPTLRETVVVGDRATLVRAAADAARRHALPLVPVDLRMAGDTHVAARAMADALISRAADERPALLMSAGETTLEVTGGGCGGRNQEYALVAAMALEGIDGAVMLAAGTDGTDGPTDAAGAFADGALCARARAIGLDPRAAIADNDSNTLLARTGDLIHTGPTGTNLMDVVLGLAF
jgi:hydroxypyruvate reductase